MKALKISFLMVVLFGGATAWSQSPVDPVLLDPPPAALPEPTIPVPMPEPAFPKEASALAEVKPEIPPENEVVVAERMIRKPAPFWECQLPTGGFLVRVSDIVTVSHHEYVVDDFAKVYETTISTRSAVVARFYYEERLSVNEDRPMTEPLLEGRLALQRARALISTGRHVREVAKPDHGLPSKHSADAALAPSSEYRLTRKADVVAIYQSAKAAWKDGAEGLFQLAE